MLFKTPELQLERHRKIYRLSPLWQRSIIGGSIWGAMEITLGSALHNLMVPMAAGTLLAFLGVFTVSAISAPSIQRGFFWRAALICSLLKSVSPSAVILPPMIGIMLEGLLMELGVLVFGANVIGMMLGGGFALLSVPLFKAARLYLLYGQGILDFFLGLVGQVSGNNVTVVANYLVYAVLIFYLIIGIIAPFIGFRLGRKNSSLKTNHVDLTFFSETSSELKYSSYLLLIVHLITFISFLLYASVMPYWAAVSIGWIYIFIVLIIYERPRKMLLMPIFIFPVLIFSFLIPLFTTKLSLVPSYGFYIFTRAVFVVVVLAAIGTELSKPAIRSLFSKGCFSPVYFATSMAFNALPIYLSIFKDTKLSASKMITGIQDVIGKTNLSANRPVVIVTGGLGEGKSTFIDGLVSLLSKEKGLAFRGFIAKGIGEPPLRDGYTLKVLPDGNELLLCKRVSACGLPNKSFEFENEVIRNLTAELTSLKQNEVLVIDEVGRMELYGEVWAELIEHHLTRTNNIVLFSVRRENLMHVVNRWNLSNAYLFDIAKVNLADAANSIKSLAFSYHPPGV